MTTDDARAFRNSLGLFATGVCVVTAMDGTGMGQGLTINSFASVSLTPPLVLWSLDKGSDTISLFAAAQSFSINVLGEGGREASQRLARKGDHGLDKDDWRHGATGAPVLAEAIAHFDCEVWARYDGGDHEIIVGLVKAHGHKTEAHPLIYYRGRYRSLASSAS